MQHILVIQLARFGDILQTKRLVATLHARPNTTLHLLVDSSMVSVAERVYPGVVVHGIGAHATGHESIDERLKQAMHTLAKLRAIGFERVYNINYSGMSQAIATVFDPEIVRGYVLKGGRPTKTDWATIGFRLTANRRATCLNLVDFWAHFTRNPIVPDAVNPVAQPSGGGIGVALAGRNARRSLPPVLLARLAMTVAHAHGAKFITLLGTAAESASAQEFLQNLKPAFVEKTIDLTGKTSFSDLFDIVGGLDCVLTPDTGIMHLAAHLGTPVTAFFLSSAWCHETGPYGKGHMVWQSVLPCSPCLETQPCPIKTACRNPFEDSTFPRCLAKPKSAPIPQGLVCFSTALDGLGVRFDPLYGNDQLAGEREALRAFLFRHLELGVDDAGPSSFERAGFLYSEPMWTLRFDHGRGETLSFMTPSA